MSHLAQRKAFERLSQAEALRALYIDFEGEGRRQGSEVPPVLLGVYRRGARPWVDVLDPVFAPLGNRVTSLHDAVLNVVMRAERRDRRLVAWSVHELEVVRTLADEDPDLVRQFEARFANGKRVAERWRNRLHGGDKPDSGRLVDYFKLIEYRLPADGVGGEVGDTIRSVRATLEQGGQLTERQTERWRRLVEHNRHDCVGLRKICLQATRELEDLEPADSRRRTTSDYLSD